MDHEIDLRKIDELASSNIAVRDRQKSEMINILRKCSNMFSFVSEAKIQLVAERLQDQGYGCVALKPTVDRILNDHEKFPPYKIILELIKTYSKKVRVDDTEYQRYVDEENRELYEIEDEFIRVFGEGKLESYVVWWFKKCYPELEPSMLNSFMANISMFKKPALFDWKDTGHTKNVNRIIDTFDRKSKQQIKRKNNPHNKEYKRLK